MKILVIQKDFHLLHKVAVCPVGTGAYRAEKTDKSTLIPVFVKYEYMSGKPCDIRFHVKPFNLTLPVNENIAENVNVAVNVNAKYSWHKDPFRFTVHVQKYGL